MAARAEVEPTTLRLKVIDSTAAPPCPNKHHRVNNTTTIILFNNISFLVLNCICEAEKETKIILMNEIVLTIHVFSSLQTLFVSVHVCFLRIQKKNISRYASKQSATQTHNINSHNGCRSRHRLFWSL